MHWGNQSSLVLPRAKSLTSKSLPSLVVEHSMISLLGYPCHLSTIPGYYCSMIGWETSGSGIWPNNIRTPAQYTQVLVLIATFPQILEQFVTSAAHICFLSALNKSPTRTLMFSRCYISIEFCAFFAYWR